MYLQCNHDYCFFSSYYARSTMYAYTKFATIDKGFDFLECLLFGALISATDPGMRFNTLRVQQCTSARKYPWQP